MKLYVCWGTFGSPRPGGHPCRNAYEALREAGWEPDVEKTYGWGVLGNALNPTRGKVREITGQNMVPVLVTDDGEVIQDSGKIIAWAKANPAGRRSGPRPPEGRRRPRWSGAYCGWVGGCFVLSASRHGCGRLGLLCAWRLRGVWARYSPVCQTV